MDRNASERRQPVGERIVDVAVSGGSVAVIGVRPVAPEVFNEGGRVVPQFQLDGHGTSETKSADSMLTIVPLNPPVEPTSGIVGCVAPSPIRHQWLGAAKERSLRSLGSPAL